VLGIQSAEGYVGGKVSGAIKQALDGNDFGATNVAAGSLIRQVGKAEEPTDTSDKKNVGSWEKNMADNKTMSAYGYVDLPQKGRPYGVASV
jgi:hypothetical protein